MRVIINIHSNLTAKATGWRAKAIQVNDKREALLDEALKAAILTDGSSLYDYIIKEGRLSDDWLLIVNGITIKHTSPLDINTKDNVQIHLMDNPHARRQA